MKKVISAIMILFITALSCSVSSAGENKIYLTSYIPAPYAEYDGLLTKWLDVDDPQAQTGQNGRNIRIKAQDGGVGGNTDGADIFLCAGAENGAGGHGDIGLNAAYPDLRLTIGNDNINSDGSILALGTQGSGRTLSSSGPGTRFLWYPRKASFRAGYVDGNQWDDSNIGDYSVAIGSLTKATRGTSTAVGHGATSSNSWGSIALGYNAVSTGIYSSAFGTSAAASGNYCMAIGENAKASVERCYVIGHGIEANQTYTVAIALNDQTGTIASQQNTMVIMGGSVGIGLTSPVSILQIASADSGFIIPKMNIAQRDSIAAGNPPAGSIIFLDESPALKEFQYFNGSEWKTPPPARGGESWVLSGDSTFAWIRTDAIWDPVDLSGIVGNQRAMVLLDISYSSALPSVKLVFKPYGDTDIYDENAISGANIINLATAGRRGTALAMTDSNGMLGAQPSANCAFVITVVAYVPVT